MATLWLKRTYRKEAGAKSPFESGIAMLNSVVNDLRRANCEGALAQLCNSLQIPGLS
jgi:hypothetical protein